MTQPIPPAPPAAPSLRQTRRATRSGGQRIVVVSGSGGEGATTVAALVWSMLADAGLSADALSRADDPLTARLPYADGSDGVLSVVDPGPHALDQTLSDSDVLVVVCAATTVSIERGRDVLAEADDRDVRAPALVVCARTESEGRRARVRVAQALRADPRVVTLPYDPALAGSARLDPDRMSATTLAAGHRVLELLGAASGGIANPAGSDRRG
ncbi:hypothetical protein ACLQ2Q_01505 [Microbacterium sp. DT81.1]|uniref:hypothetical protein n=1 Tax=Microbacterium sp. DT81.1 TaxID=3393413 RepID=UPI003CF82BFD